MCRDEKIKECMDELARKLIQYYEYKRSLHKLGLVVFAAKELIEATQHIKEWPC